MTNTSMGSVLEFFLLALGALGLLLLPGISVAEYPAGQVVPLFHAGDDANRQGFVRLINHANATADLEIRAYDEAGEAYGPVALSLAANQTIHFNSSDFEDGNQAKGLAEGIGMGEGDWWLEFNGSSDIEAAAYVRHKTDGFLTSMHGVVPADAAGLHQVAYFNPGSNPKQISWLRLVNRGDEPALVEVSGVDDAGSRSADTVRFSVAARASRMLSARHLESGQGLDGALGDGTGKWALTVKTDQPLLVMSLLESPTGHLTNLSAQPVQPIGGVHRIMWLPSADDINHQGFVRIANRSTTESTVTVLPHDDSGNHYESITLTLGAGETIGFNSNDLELGNARKGIAGGTGPGSGDWWLALSGPPDIDVTAYVRHKTDGFLTAVHQTLPTAGQTHRAVILNPGTNNRQASWLRLVNVGEAVADVAITGTADRFRPPARSIELSVPARQALTIASSELEAGSDRFDGMLWDGDGKWQLVVASDQPLLVASMLDSPSGHVTNLSSAPNINTAPIDAEAFTRRMAKRRIGDAVNWLAFKADGTFAQQQADENIQGDYVYRRTARAQGNVTLSYADGRVCSEQITFKTRWAGQSAGDCGLSGIDGWAAIDANEVAGSALPVRWVFAGELTESEKAQMRDELSHVRRYFLNAFGVKAEGFVVVVAEDYDALAKAYPDVTGVELRHTSRE